MVKKRKGFAKWIRKIESISDPEVTSVLREEWKVLPSGLFLTDLLSVFVDYVLDNCTEGDYLPRLAEMSSAFSWGSHPAGYDYFKHIARQSTPVTQEFIELCEFWKEELL